MKLNNLLTWGEYQLLNISDTPNLDAEILLRMVLGLSKTKLFLEANKEIEELNRLKFQDLIKERRAGKPIAYLTNNKEFFKLDFFVNEDVLIPRSDSEVLVEEALDYLANNSQINKVIDLGTGSGCIAVSIAKDIGDAGLRSEVIKFIASDICPKTLIVAEKNINKHHLKDSITLVQSDLCQKLELDNKTLIVANLPYINEGQVLPTEVSFEPKKALFGGRDGLDYYRKLLVQARDFRPSAMILEVDSRQIEALNKEIEQKMKGYKIELGKDLSNNYRVLKLIKTN